MPRRGRRHKKTPSQCDSSCAAAAVILQDVPVPDDAPVSPPSSAVYEVRQSDLMGRYVVAKRALREGTMVISEEPLVVGPVQNSTPVCLGCYTPEPTLRCSKCQWPLCSSSCRGLGKRLGHSPQECEQLVSCRLHSDHLAGDLLYNAVMPLRCLLLRESCPVAWATLQTMEAHNTPRRNNPRLWQYNQSTVVDRIIREWQITRYSEDDIHTICGILEVNAFTIGDELLKIQGVYPTAFLLAHSCSTNTSHTDEGQFLLKIYTSVPISEGDLITVCYTDSLQGTRKRRAHLQQCKFFLCTCDRCRDPTELGTMMSAVRCGACPGHLLPADPLQLDSQWHCAQCSAHLSAATVFSLTDRIEVELQALDKNDIVALERAIEHHTNTLHKNHYLLVRLKLLLTQMYGKSRGYLIHEMSQEQLELKRQLCQDMLAVLDKVEPGLTPARGLTLYEIHAPVMVVTLQQFEMRRISKSELSRRLRLVASYLRESITVLRFEPPSSQEGKVRIAAEEALSQLKSWQPVVGHL